MSNKGLKRPVGLNILVLFILWLAVWNCLRMSEAIFYWNSLEEYGAQPLYISMSGGIWFIIGILLVWGLWWCEIWGWMATLGAAVSYTTWYWLDRLILQKPHSNWLFALIENIVLLIFIILLMFSRKTRLHFQKDAHERKSQTSTTQ